MGLAWAAGSVRFLFPSTSRSRPRPPSAHRCPAGRAIRRRD